MKKLAPGMDSENDYNLNKEDRRDCTTEEFQTLRDLPFIYTSSYLGDYIKWVRSHPFIAKFFRLFDSCKNFFQTSDGFTRTELKLFIQKGLVYSLRIIVVCLTC